MKRANLCILGLVCLLLTSVGQVWATDYTITTGLADSTKAEGASQTYTVTVSPAPGTDTVNVPYSVSGTVTSGDYTISGSGTLVFTGSTISQDITLNITDESTAENEETLILTLGATSVTPASGNTATLSGTNPATVTIPVNDYAYTITTGLTDTTVAEDGGPVNFTVFISPTPAPGITVTLPYATSNGTATAGSDYTTTSGTLTFDASHTDHTVAITISPDSDYEGNELFTFATGTPTVTAGNTVTSSGPSSATITIRDNDYRITISPDFSKDVDDGTAPVIVTVSPVLASGDEIKVDYATADGTATQPNDYTNTNGTLTFNTSSSNPQTVSIPISNDGTPGGAENFSLQLSNIVPSSGESATFSDDTCTITLTDHAFTVNAGSDLTVAEDGGNLVFTVGLDRDPTGTEVITVNYATADGSAHAGSDYTATTGTLTIDATDTANDKKITVPIVDDAAMESAEQFTVQLTGASANTSISSTNPSAIGTITDEDYSVPAFADISFAETVGTAQLTVTLDRTVAPGDSVDFTVSHTPGSASAGGVDYTAPLGTLNIPAGSSSGTIDIPINNDTLVELAETFDITVTPTSGNVTVADSTATVTIDIHDKYAVTVNDVSMQEADANMDFTISISPALQAEHNGLAINLQTVNSSAIAPADYTAIPAGSVTFTTGQTNQTQAVTIKEDTLDEGVSERFWLNLTGSSLSSIVTLSDSWGQGTILDTDYAITPTWNEHGTVSLQSPVGTGVPITNGSGVAIANNTPARFTVAADYRIHSVTIDGTVMYLYGGASGTLAYITAVETDEKNHTYTFENTTPQGAHTIDVLFDHQIAMTATGSGTVTHTSATPPASVTGGTANVIADHGANENFQFSAAGGNCVTDLLIDSSSVGAFTGSNNWHLNSYTFSNVVDNHTIEATYGTAAITVNIGADDGATGTADDTLIQGNSAAIWRAYAADSSYTPGLLIKEGTHGQSFSLPADTSCNTRYIVIQFYAVDGWTKPNDIQLDLANQFHDQAVEGLYDRESYILTLVAAHGTINITDTAGDPVGEPYTGENRYIIPADTDIHLTAISDPAWYFQVWQGDASGSANPVALTMDQDRTVEAVFVQGCQDNDGDGYTTADLSGTGCFVSPEIDCNDNDAEINPGATEICGDSVDQDCSGSDLSCGSTDTDNDGDGYTENQGDCNDSDSGIHPGLYDDPATPEDEDCYGGAKEEGTEITCAHPSDVPANAARKPAPPLLMFLLDDSGSMDWEFMTSESNQLFSSKYYIYPVGDSQRAYTDNRLDATQRRKWKSQWSGENRIFFNPSTTYDPWPKWEEIIGAANIRAHEEEYDPDAGGFPNTAYAKGLTHADMDRPRLNTYDSSTTINAMYHPGDASGSHASYELDMNAEFTRVKLGGQQVMVTRDTSSTGSSTHADAIGLSTNASLALTVGHTYAWYLANPANIPSIIFDNSDGSTIYTETGTWYDSGGDSSYEWENNDRYTDAAGRSAIWKLNLTSGQIGDYYVYVWVDEYNTRDDNALYTIFSYDQVSGELVSQTVRKDQSPTNSSGTPTTGARWIRLNSTPIHFVAQTTTDLIIPNAHYYTWYDRNGDGDYWDDTDSDGIKDTGEVEDSKEKYLITIPGSGYGVGNYSLHYYLFNDVNYNDTVEDGELSEVTGTAIPSAIIPVKYDAYGNQITANDELAYVVRQDFADWFSFYRRRILTAKAAIGLTVADMRQLKLGVHTINRTYHEPLVWMAEADSPEKTSYLTTIYNIRPKGSTYLRRGLDDVGLYFERGTTGDYTNLKTTEGLCTGDTSVFYDANKDVDTDTCDDAGGECQRAYVIAMTDGYYNDGYSSARVGNADNGSPYTALRDGASNSLADFAHFYYNTDLDSVLGNYIPARGFDDAPHQHLVSYMVSFGVFGYFNPDSFPDCLPACETPGEDGCPQIADLTVKTWTESGGKAVFSGSAPYSGTCPDWHNSIFEDSPKAIDDLYHASVNGRGEFYNAADPAELVTAMQNIKQLIEAKVGTASSVAVNARKIQDNTLLFQTTYDSSDWSGDILAKCLDAQGNMASCDGVTCESGCNSSYTTCVNSCPVGDAACETVCVTARTACLSTNHCEDYMTCSEAKDACIDACAGNATCEAACSSAEDTCQDNPPEVKWSARNELASVTSDNRKIITSDGTSGKAFRWADISGPMKSALNNQEDLLNYLRGSSEYERRNDMGSVHNYRNRPNSVLGDFINSEPLYYKNTALGIDWVFAGANDGMLHVIDGQTGEEIFAFIPNAVFNNLKELASEGYNDVHRFFVDGYMTIKDVGNKVILVGGMGKGGKGYFALDLTAAAANKAAIETHAADIFLWEYTDITQADPIKSDLGYSFSRTLIVPSNDPSVPWILIFGNGYDSANGKAVLFTVGLNSDGEIQWTQEIDTLQGDTLSNCNGLSSPAVLFPHGDGVDDYLYAGDLLGNLWKFDLRMDDRANWKIYFNDGTNPQPLFQARSDAGWRQPITMQPDATKSCALGVPGYLIGFGTGRLLDPDVDAADFSVQTAYGVWDWSPAWEEAGYAHPEQMYLGYFMPATGTPPAGCITNCSTLAGDCVADCLGNTECIAECTTNQESCEGNCSAVRNLSNIDNIPELDASSAAFVTLLRQTQIWGGGVKYNSDGSINTQDYGATDSAGYDEITRILSQNQVDWLLHDPDVDGVSYADQLDDFKNDANRTVKHLGWYFDLPVNGERIIRDMIILNHKLVYTSSIPSDSPCESGGLSNYFAVDVCTGGSTNTPFYDINNDGVIDSRDYINIGTAANPIYAAPTSIQVEGLGPGATIVEVQNELDRLYFPEDSGDGGGAPDTSGVLMEGYGKAIQYWRELDWK